MLSTVFFFSFSLHWCWGKGERAGALWVWSLYKVSRRRFLGARRGACKESCPEDVDDWLHKHTVAATPDGRTPLRHPTGADTWPCTVASPAGCLAAVWGYCWSRRGPLVCPSSLKQTGTFMKDQLTLVLLCLDLLVLKVGEKDFLFVLS